MTTETRHTPGPLRASDTPVYHIRDRNGRRVGLAYTRGDGRLWAAAPQLLEALQAVLDHEDVTCWGPDSCDGGSRPGECTYHLIQRAMRKATGDA